MPGPPPQQQGASSVSRKLSQQQNYLPAAAALLSAPGGRVPQETDPLLEDGRGPKNSAWADVEDSDGHRGNEKAMHHRGASGSLIEWIAMLRQHFGYKLLVLLFFTQHLLKGFIDSFVTAADSYIFRQYKVPAPQMQILGAVVGMPWAIKPVIGLISDILPVCGYNKMPYCLATSFLGAIAFLIIGLVPQESLPLLCLVGCMCLVRLQVATNDLLSEAKYAEKIREKPSYGPDIITYVWFGLQLGGLVAVSLSGTFIEYAGPKALYAMTAFPAALVIIPVCRGYLEESCLTTEEVTLKRQKFLEQKEVCFLCLVMLAGTTLLTIVGVSYADPVLNGVVSIVVALVLLAAFSLVLSPIIAKFIAFVLIQNSLTLSISGASFYFYTDTVEQYPEGPHFTPLFYNTVMGVCAALCSLVGIYLYQRYASTWTYRRVMMSTNIAYSCLCLLDVAMFARMNRRLVINGQDWSIPDHAFVLGSSILETVVEQWTWMPSIVILSYLCPRGMEATMYALLAGCGNLGSVVSRNVGALLLHQLNVKPNGSVGESMQFERLWEASAIATVLPLFTIVLLFWLIPDVKQNESLISGTGCDAATEGSLLRRWLHYQNGTSERRSSRDGAREDSAADI